MVKQIEIEQFLELSDALSVIDVRSPIEFEEDHVPGSVNIPLFSNDERAEIGTAYTHVSPERAVEIGESYAVPRIPRYLEQAERQAREGEILILCARGGMRSQKFSELLAEHGLHPIKLIGGYKSYRRHVQASFEQILDLTVLGGRTGCGKTDILLALKKRGEQVLDLEGLANHRGSAFGSVGLGAQPGTKQFENMLFTAIRGMDTERPIWVEDEGKNIGRVALPAPFYRQLESAALVLIDMARQQRIRRLCVDYGNAGSLPLEEALGKIRKRVGGDNYNKALEAIRSGDLPAAVSLVLDYYDKCYDYYQESRKREIRRRILVENEDMTVAAGKIKDQVEALPEDSKT